MLVNHRFPGSFQQLEKPALSILEQVVFQGIKCNVLTILHDYFVSKVLYHVWSQVASAEKSSPIFDSCYFNLQTFLLYTNTRT